MYFNFISTLTSGCYCSYTFVLQDSVYFIVKCPVFLCNYVSLNVVNLSQNMLGNVNYTVVQHIFCL